MKLYIKPWCPWCIDAVDWMSKKGLVFEQIDVTKDAAAYAEMRKISGQSLTPTLQLPGGDVLPDFDTKQLEKFLRARNISF